jgi:hypothetical protein
MSQIFYSLAVLACPVGMGAMMFFMMRGGKRQQATNSAQFPGQVSPQEAELIRMRAEIDQLRQAQSPRDSSAEDIQDAPP